MRTLVDVSWWTNQSQPPRGTRAASVLTLLEIKRVAPAQAQPVEAQPGAPCLGGEPLAELAVGEHEPRAPSRGELRGDDRGAQRSRARQDLHVARAGQLAERERTPAS